ncbi:hypothetical protein FHL15_008033 [Xylaria flabelliformis]|uniref:Uncharacterized protein n=1 Tax=Xylaria flabelliformis TaxID=2512241 RepID=A0A553HSY3_9PEZI|nr:hypothetical protein FHL15_008033 [Xylaria flabelliformis]
MTYISNPSEPVAIVGSSCRFPGDVTSPSKLGDLICRPYDLSREAPPERFNAKSFYHPNGKHHGTTNSIKAYWLNANPASFDAPFFHITPKEAEALDPQQRLLLEVVYEAMEAAGFPLDQYSGKEVGVFSGCMTNDYESISSRDQLLTSEYFSTGSSRAILANRISYFFNFRGPSLSLDTACSSGLFALDLAIQALRDGRCTVACVTGANLMLSPDQFIVESSLGLLSPAGKCHMWDTRADGYARGEGMAALIIKPLSLAIANGDQIEAVIRETATNADGKTAQITEPNSEAQAVLIRETYKRAGLDPSNPLHQCQYFEAHGTGTQAGDPREAAAIHDAFFGNANRDRDDTQPSSPSEKKLLVGSIKTVIGHTEATAGLAGILKVVWALKHGVIPPNLHFENLNPKVQPFYTQLQIPTVAMPWPDPPVGQPRRASVNSFGFGGANAHAIVEAYTPEIHGAAGPTWPRTESAEEATGVLAVPVPVQVQPQPQPQTHLNGKRFHLPIVLSAASPKSLRDVVQSYRTYLTENNNNVNLLDLAWHQYSHRSDLPYRVAISASSRTEALVSLDSLLFANNSTVPSDSSQRSISAKSPLRILGIFTGQGAQWPTMSRDLFQQNSLYRDTIRKLDAVLSALPQPCEWKLEDQILADQNTSRVQEAAVSQPLCTAVQIALVDFLRSIGIDFHTVVGHSSGEIAAAYAAGELSAQDAIVVSYYRGREAHRAGSADGQKGGMMAANMSESEALDFCSDPLFGGRICIAADNSPSSVTLSGDLDVIQQAYKVLIDKKKSPRMLRVPTAYHSPHMEPFAGPYADAMREYRVSPIPGGNGIQWVSSVKGRPRTGATDLDCQYWADNMVNQVQFRDAVEYALSQSGDEFDCALEVGPHPALQGPFTQIVVAHNPDRTIPYACPLNRSGESERSVSEFLGRMWSKFGSKSIDLRTYIEQCSMSSLLHSRLFNLPSYPFDHSVDYWRESRYSRQYHSREEASHELLGVRSREDGMHEMKWRNILKLDELPWLEGHKFQNQALLPASAYCVMALDAARYLLAGRPASLVELRDVDIVSGIAVDQDSPGVEIVFCLRISPSDKNSSTIDATFDLCSCPANTSADSTDNMKRNASGSIHIVLGKPSMSALPRRQPPLSETLPADPEAFYKMMTATGLDYTGPFKALTTVNRRYEYCCATLSRIHADETTTLKISPATLDACFHTSFLAYAAPGDGSLWTTFLPAKISSIQFNLAILESDAAADPKATLTVDTRITGCTSPIDASKATLSVDLAVFNEAGEAEIQVEELVVHAWAHANPRDDVELYLHTVMDVDPTDEIVGGDDAVPEVDDNLLVESCRRVASFYLHNNHPVSSDTRETIDEMIRNSKHADYLDSIRSASQMDPARLSESLPLIEEEARQVSIFRNKIGRIVKQIVHRYPWMNILHLATTQTGLDRSVLAAIGDSFQSLTVSKNNVYPSSASRNPVTQSAAKVQERDINVNENLAAQIGSEVSLDLVILPTALLGNGNRTRALKNISELMKPGAFLILVDSHNTISSAQPKTLVSHPTTPPHWHDALDACGFTQGARNSNQSYPVGSVLVRQFREPSILSETGISSTITDTLLLIGSASEKGDDHLVASLRDQLSSHCGEIIYRSLDTATTQDLETCTAAIMLADLEEPLMSNMTEHRMNQLRILFRPALSMLWITRDARSGNPENAASFGFLRTMAAEVANLKLQVLDLEPTDTESSATTIVTIFSQLASADIDAGGSSLSKPEPEIHMENGRRLIPRVVPWNHGNDKVNALRRVVTRPVTTALQHLKLIPEAISPTSFRFELKEKHHIISEPPPGNVAIQVEYSSALPLKLDEKRSNYICVGRKLKTEERMIALSVVNSSYIICPTEQVVLLEGDASSSLTVLHQLVRYIAALTMLSMANCDEKIILIAPDVELARCLVHIVALRSPSGPQVAIIEPCYDETEPSPYADIAARDPERCALFRPHPRTSMNNLRQILPRDGGIFNFLPEDDEFSRAIAASVSRRHAVYSGLALFGSKASTCWKDCPAIQFLWKESTSLAVETTPMVSKAIFAEPLSELQSQSGPSSLFRIVDWKLDTGAVQRINHTTDEKLLFPYKTYFLFGLTRDFGHSLCRLFLDRGARHIVLASRNPPTTSPGWVVELNKAYGANIRIERADVTSLESLRSLRREIAETTPRIIGGVVNGAMVLEDRAFSEMSIATWKRVLGPKTIGSSNLDAVFGNEAGLDFFIMTSSFAAIGGHAGQSNYAAANSYMNGLAAFRRRCGLPGAALNIGVIYGLGFLHREREELYGGLERDGYPPISERDLHHMFLEAMVTGRPGSDGPGEITTGLRRFRRDTPNPLHWHLDPRFGHFYEQNSETGETEELKMNGTSFQQVLASLNDPVAVADAIGAALEQRLRTLLGLPESAVIDRRSGLLDLGLDSISGVEVLRWFTMQLGRNFALIKILDAPSIEKLCLDTAEQYLESRSEKKKAGSLK